MRVFYEGKEKERKGKERPYLFSFNYVQWVLYILDEDLLKGALLVSRRRPPFQISQLVKRSASVIWHTLEIEPRLPNLHPTLIVIRPRTHYESQGATRANLENSCKKFNFPFYLF